jgi:DNA polymerase-3 subunit epsilon
MHIEGDWAWPLHAVLDHDSLVHHALGDPGAAPDERHPALAGGT